MKVSRCRRANRVQEGVDYRIASIDAELSEKALHALARLADQDAPGHPFVLAGARLRTRLRAEPVEGPIVRGTEELEPTDLLVAGAQFHKAADVLEGSALQGTFRGAADRFFETGLSRLKEAD